MGGWIPRCRRGRGGDRGAALVEAALILPFLVSVLLGMITGGVALATKNSMANAVREGTRFGATLPEGTSWDAWAVAVRDQVVALAGGDLTNDQVCVRIESWDGSSGTTQGSWPTGSCPVSGAPSVPPSTPTGACVVAVWAGRTAEFNALFFARDVVLEEAAVARYERTECP